MPTFLERYQNCEREQVWAELVALGAAVRQQPVYDDALAVARETMTRARANVETLYGRLQTLGYAFEYPDEAFTPPAPGIRAQLDAFEKAVGPIPLSLRAWCEIVGEVNFIGNHPGLAYFAPSISSGMARAIESNLTDFRGLIGDLVVGPGARPVDPEIMDEVAEQMKQRFPNLVNSAFLDLLKGQVQTQKEKPSAKAHQQGNVPAIASDPLVVQAAELLSEEMVQDWMETTEGEDEDDEGYYASIAPDIHHKANFSGSGGYDIRLPDPAADAPLLNEEHDTTFVNYLRLSFQWGGFPGLEDESERDDKLLQTLKEGLLPI